MSMIEVKVPMLPESVSDATVATWHKKPGDVVKRDENLVDLETDKVVLEVPAPADGILSELLKSDGDTVLADEALAKIDTAASASAAPAKPSTTAATPAETKAIASVVAEPAMSPSVRHLMAEHDIDASQITGSGKSGRIVKEDVQRFISDQQGQVASPSVPATSSAAQIDPDMLAGRTEKRVPMSRLRARIAERLLQAQSDNAILTTFNEVNLQAVMDARAKYRDQFEKKHGIRLGFMSFFVKASVEALKRFAAVNASIDGNDIVYHGFYDIGVAVSTERGLVVPVLRDADQMSMAEIEATIRDFGQRAQKGQISIEEMTGGTFTITNGGVFGSLLSTPILNPPQSAILGMHKIEERPVVENGQVVVRPMMYLAMSYDHRIIDGKDSVQFLVAIKECLEDPMRLMLEV